MRRARGKHEQFRRDVKNGCMRCSSECPIDASEAHRQMEHYSPVFFRRKQKRMDPSIGKMAQKPCRSVSSVIGLSQSAMDQGTVDLTRRQMAVR